MPSFIVLTMAMVIAVAISISGLEQIQNSGAEQIIDLLESRIGNAERTLVSVGQTVTRGQPVALMGSTGHSTGPHVHFEIRDGDLAVNPRTVLPKPKVAQAPPSGDPEASGVRVASAARAQ